MSAAPTTANREASDRHTEERVAASIDRIVEEGAPRLHRSWSGLLSTGMVAGAEVSIGVLALLVVSTKTGQPLLGALAFGFGFLALLLGHSELFTEGFLVPVTVVVAGEARVRDMLRLWVGTAAANLAGGWIVMWLGMVAFPAEHHTAIEQASYFINQGITFRALALAILAGAVMTLLTRMHNGTDDMPSKVISSLFAAFLLPGLQLAHSILDSLLIFGALQTGHAPFGYADYFGWLGWAVLGNVIGGIGLVTLLRLIRSRDLLAEHRRHADPKSRTVAGATAEGRD